MLDTELIRNDPDLIRASLRNRNYSEELLDEFLRLDGEWRKVVDEGNRLRHERNRVSELIPKLKGEEKQNKIAEMKQVAERIKQIDAAIIELEAARERGRAQHPQPAGRERPGGKDCGGQPDGPHLGRDPQVRLHPEGPLSQIGEELDIIDFERGTKIAGSGFYVLKGDGARLERAMINFMLDLHHQQGYTEVFPPVVVNRAAVIGTGQYPKMKDDMYWCERDDLWLNPTAEVPVTNLLRTRSSRRTSCRSTTPPTCRRSGGRRAATRRCGGSSGSTSSTRWSWSSSSCRRDPSPNWRPCWTMPRRSCRMLELPYRVLLLCTGDMGFASAKTYDIEAHAPGSRQWLEMLVLQLLHRFPGQAGQDQVPSGAAPEERVRAHPERFGRGAPANHGVGPGEQPDRGTAPSPSRRYSGQYMQGQELIE